MVRMKLFSPERANALIPKLTPLVEELLEKRRSLAIKLLEHGTLLRGVEPSPSRLAGVRSPFPPPRFGELKSEIVRLIHRIEGLGCFVKDLDLGLIDFPSSRDGQEVYLCWKAGEPAVTHWHRVDEGFATRRPL
jgi:hypothetical protein